MIDTLSTGLGVMVRNSWLLVLPIAFDLFLWFAPPLIMGDALHQAVMPSLNFKTFLAGAPDPETVVQAQQMYDSMALQVAQTNFWSWGVPNWLFFPSAMVGTSIAPVVPTADLGALAANDSAWVMNTPISFISMFVALSLLGVLVNVAWLHTVAFAITQNAAFLKVALILRSFLNVVALLVLALFIFIGLTLIASLFVAVLTLVLPGGATIATLLLLAGAWWLVWIGVQLYFTIAALIVGRHGLVGAPNSSATLLRRHTDNPYWRSGYGFIAITFILTWGFAIIWHSLMVTPVGRMVSIVGNAALGTGIAAAMMLFYYQRIQPQPKENPVAI
jgi:hypothetical protein